MKICYFADQTWQYWGQLHSVDIAVRTDHREAQPRPQQSFQAPNPKHPLSYRCVVAFPQLSVVHLYTHPAGWQCLHWKVKSSFWKLTTFLNNIGFCVFSWAWMYATWQQNITGLGRDSISSVSLIQGLAGPDVTRWYQPTNIEPT